MTILKSSKFYVSPQDGATARLDTDSATFSDDHGNQRGLHEIAPCRPLQRFLKWFRINFRQAKVPHADRRRQAVQRRAEALRSMGPVKR